MDSFNEAWNIICEYCKNNTTTFAYDVWIKKIEPVGLDFDKGEVTLLVPNDFHRQTLQKCYIPLLNDAFDSVFGTHFQIVFQVPQEVNNIQEKEQKSTAETGYDFTFDTFIAFFFSLFNNFITMLTNLCKVVVIFFISTLCSIFNFLLS